MSVSKLYSVKLVATRLIIASTVVVATTLAAPCSAQELALPAADAQQDDSTQITPEEMNEDEGSAIDRIQRAEAENVPKLTGGRFLLPPLRVNTTATENVGNGRVPDSFRDEHPVEMRPLPESASDRYQDWNWSVSYWEAPNTFSYPLFFEDRMLERHGHSWFGCCGEPIAAGTRFFASAAMLPYLATVNPPCECEYKLGHYRSGNCAPNMLQRPPYEARATLAEALWIGGAIAIIP